MKKEKVCLAVFFIGLVVVLVIIGIVAYLRGCSTLDLPTAVIVVGAMLLGFVLLLASCRLSGKIGEKRESPK